MLNIVNRLCVYYHAIEIKKSSFHKLLFHKNQFIYNIQDANILFIEILIVTKLRIKVRLWKKRAASIDANVIFFTSKHGSRCHKYQKRIITQSSFRFHSRQIFPDNVRPSRPKGQPKNTDPNCRPFPTFHACSCLCHDIKAG